MPVLPRAAGIDESSIDVSIFDPLLHLSRYELGTIVAFDCGRFFMQINELIEHANHIERREITCTLDPRIGKTR